MREENLPDPANLPDDPALLKQIIAQQNKLIAELLVRMEKQTHEIEQLKRMHFGPRSERIDPKQMLMSFANQSFPATPPPPGTPPRGGGTRAAASATKTADDEGHGRQKLPPHLKREPRVLDVSEDQKRCVSCKKPLVKIGEDVSEQLEYTPSQLHVIRNIRPKYT